VLVGDRHETYGLKSSRFRDWLVDGYFVDQHEPPPDWAVRRVLGVLEARTRFDRCTPPVFVRVGEDRPTQNNGPVYWVDIGDYSGRAIKISALGWVVVDRPEVHFRRPEGLSPLPIPSPDGSIDLLRAYVNLSEGDFRLLITWLTAALRPVGPYPILVLNGEQGSAKSILINVVRLLIDPQARPLVALPKGTRDVMVTALNGWLLAYDNISAIPVWLSDVLCSLATEGGFAGRSLFSKDERTVIHVQRPTYMP